MGPTGASLKGNCFKTNVSALDQSEKSCVCLFICKDFIVLFKTQKILLLRQPSLVFHVVKTTCKENVSKGKKCLVIAVLCRTVGWIRGPNISSGQNYDESNFGPTMDLGIFWYIKGSDFNTLIGNFFSFFPLPLEHSWFNFFELWRTLINWS